MDGSIVRGSRSEVKGCSVEIDSKKGTVERERGRELRLCRVERTAKREGLFG